MRISWRVTEGFSSFAGFSSAFFSFSRSFSFSAVFSSAEAAGTGVRWRCWAGSAEARMSAAVAADRDRRRPLHRIGNSFEGFWRPRLYGYARVPRVTSPGKSCKEADDAGPASGLDFGRGPRLRRASLRPGGGGEAGARPGGRAEGR